MVRATGSRPGVIDPLVTALREAYVRRGDGQLTLWWTKGAEDRWKAERVDWTAGKAMICTTVEVFDALMAAGLDREASRFTHAADRADSRRWLIPGVEGGRLAEVVQHDGDWYLIDGTRTAGA